MNREAASVTMKKGEGLINRNDFCLSFIMLKHVLMPEML